MSFLGSAAGAIGGSLVGGLVGSYSAKQNAALSLGNWKYMQSNAHQLEVEDLKKAGLNPILSATNGQIAGLSSVNGSDYGAGQSFSSAIQAEANRRLEKENKLLDVNIKEKELDNEAKRIQIEDFKAKSQANLGVAQIRYLDTTSANDTARTSAQVSQIEQDIKNGIEITKATVQKYGAESVQARSVAYNQLKQAALAIEQITGQKLSNEDYQTFMKNPQRLLEKDTFDEVRDNPFLRGLFETAYYLKSVIGGVDSVSFGRSGFRFGSSHK